MWQQFIYSDADGDHPYFVYTPETYRVGAPVPLFVMLHGCTQTALDFATGTSMNRLAEKQGFIVVYPQQTIKYNQGLCWNWFLPSNQQRGSGEPASIVGMIQSMQLNTANWTIDPNRIYVTGISAGAAMSVILGATYPDVFKAIGVHSGLEYQTATRWCNNGYRQIILHLTRPTRLTIINRPALPQDRFQEDIAISRQYGTLLLGRQYRPIGKSMEWVMPGQEAILPVPTPTREAQMRQWPCTTFSLAIPGKKLHSNSSLLLQGYATCLLASST